MAVGGPVVPVLTFADLVPGCRETSVSERTIAFAFRFPQPSIIFPVSDRTRALVRTPIAGPGSWKYLSFGVNTRSASGAGRASAGSGASATASYADDPHDDDRPNERGPDQTRTVATADAIIAAMKKAAGSR